MRERVCGVGVCVFVIFTRLEVDMEQDKGACRSELGPATHPPGIAGLGGIVAVQIWQCHFDLSVYYLLVGGQRAARLAY